MNQDRNDHFKGYAELQYPELAKLFARRMLGSENADSVAREIKEYLAQRAYDLVYHIRRQTGYGMDLFDIERWIAEDVPDLTKLPPIPPQP